MEWQQVPDRRGTRVRGIWLLKRATVVRESPNASIAPKVVIERAVFLNENHHVLDVVDI
jgi:hypothetical protein